MSRHEGSKAPVFARCGSALVLASALAGCASGPPFTSVEPPPAGKAAVYIYRPPAFAQAVNRYLVTFDRGFAMPVELKNGSWGRSIADPGTHAISATGQVMLMRCAPATIDVAPGQVAFVELSLAMWGDGQGRTLQSCKLSPVPSEKALAAISGLAKSD